MTAKSDIILSTDTLTGYGLDYIFNLAKKSGFDGIELAIWKNFDTQNISYVKKLSEKYKLKIFSIQTSGSLNKKEINKALDLCEALGCTAININAPSFFDYKSFNFIKSNIKEYIRKNPDIKFSIINPTDSSFFILPLPKYRFSNLVEIIKKYECYIALDISNLDEESFENEFYRKMEDFLPYISNVYLSDKDKTGKGHLIPGEGILKLPSFLKKLKQKKYKNPLSVKVNITKEDLADYEKTEIILTKAINYYKEHYKDIKTEE